MLMKFFRNFKYLNRPLSAVYMLKLISMKIVTTDIHEMRTLFVLVQNFQVHATTFVFETSPRFQISRNEKLLEDELCTRIKNESALDIEYDMRIYFKIFTPTQNGI